MLRQSTRSGPTVSFTPTDDPPSATPARANAAVPVLGQKRTEFCGLTRTVRESKTRSDEGASGDRRPSCRRSWCSSRGGHEAAGPGLPFRPPYPSILSSIFTRSCGLTRTVRDSKTRPLLPFFPTRPTPRMSSQLFPVDAGIVPHRFPFACIAHAAVPPRRPRRGPGLRAAPQDPRRRSWRSTQGARRRGCRANRYRIISATSHA